MFGLDEIALWFEVLGIDPLVGITGIILILVVLAILMREVKILHYVLLCVAAAINLPLIFMMILMSFVPGHGSDYPLIVPLSFFVSGGMIVSVIIFIFFAGEKRIWRYFWLGWVIFMGFPFFLLLNWFV